MENVVFWPFSLKEFKHMYSVFIVIQSKQVTSMREFDLIYASDVESMVRCNSVGFLGMHGTISYYD